MINGQITNVEVWNPEWARWQSAPGSIRVDEAIQTKLVIQNTGNEAALYGCFLMYIDPYGSPRDSFILPPEGGSFPLNPGETYESPIISGGMYGTAIYPGQWRASIRLFVWNDLNTVIEVPSNLVIANVEPGPDRNIAQIVNVGYLKDGQYQSIPPNVEVGETIGVKATIKNIRGSYVDVVADLKIIGPDGYLVSLPPNPPGFWQWTLNPGEQVSFSGICSAQQNGQYWAWIEIEGNFLGSTPSLVLDQKTVVIAQVGAAPPPPPPPPPAAPVINSFAAVPGSINSGESSVLSWNVSDATAVSIDQGIGEVTATGQVAVSPTVTTVYTLTASNADGTVTSTVTVTVGAAPPPPPPVAPAGGISAIPIIGAGLVALLGIVLVKRRQKP